MKIITKRSNGSIRVQVITSQNHELTQENEKYKDQTQQQFKDDVDINNIVSKFKKGQSVPLKHPGYYQDWDQATNLMDAQEQIKTASASFMQLPATVREKFKNDPLSFLDFVQNPSNKEEAQKMGLLKNTEQEITLKDIHQVLKEQKKNDSNEKNSSKNTPDNQ